jgi:hypothetical protein
VIRTYASAGPNMTPAETWSSGHRTPYGLAFAPDGKFWEMEHGPRGGDELNLIEPPARTTAGRWSPTRSTITVRPSVTLVKP